MYAVFPIHVQVRHRGHITLHSNNHGYGGHVERRESERGESKRMKEKGRKVERRDEG